MTSVASGAVVGNMLESCSGRDASAGELFADGRADEFGAIGVVLAHGQIESIGQRRREPHTQEGRSIFLDCATLHLIRVNSVKHREQEKLSESFGRCLIGSVPNQRKPGQTFIGAQVSEELLYSLEKGRKILRIDRSQFVREAIKEKLVALGYDVPDVFILPPDRAAPVANPGFIQNQSGTGVNIQSLRVAESPAAKAPSRRAPVNYLAEEKRRKRKPKK